MADDSTTTIRATFNTRAASNLAVDHLVQQHGISRPDICIQSATAENTSGSVASGGDVSKSASVRGDAPLEGEIEASADIPSDKISAVQRGLGEAGAFRVSGAA
ncbi:hypothetical protein [Agrobacterium rubi]|uniref:Uncharacterized protein n=2 Tax=Agrobacterium rubi TaxID=28099 RepID=A0AAE7UU41_9HYPH|nr:hypothetical protein [Agrobacterium rubi]MBP1880599.1 hypothetical protein [Agrobacterium rubi]NTE89478.1 hypothetical protein [Agrobacterium rubi]NTF05614.1 hypothetical protein [Agrobacterium rubi]NTF39615.1 hypothetical protein [Agrobacterium rubi]OCJ51047.1 hypothetical protein A6U92_05225 [Agrobacterium rubi]